VQEASLDELQKVSGIGKELAEKIYSYLRNEK
jgi:ERCC4-type nuclease